MSTPEYTSRIPDISGQKPATGFDNLLAGVKAHSPYLSALIDRFPQTIQAMQLAGPDSLLSSLEQQVFNLSAQMPRADFSRELRQAKQQVHLVLALAELGQVWTCEQVMQHFSGFAETCIGACMSHAFARYRLDMDECGFFVVGFGKLAGGELNYSSDVDLAFFHDSHKLMQAGIEPHKLVRVAREMVALLSEVTAHGYGFRVDLRLRPDPSSTPIVMSSEAALIYYESMGQTWERAAWIKARALCGDAGSAEDFMAQMQPFIWRRYRDFAAIDEIHRIRQRSLQTTNAEEPGEPGYNVKTGPGGIREIELLAQTLQLIHGGREPGLRVGPSLTALDRLVAANLIVPETVAQLRTRYFFLRTVEHAMQMHGDQQTHLIPEQVEEAEHVAALSGFASAGAWQQSLARCGQEVMALVAQALPERQHPGEGSKNPFALGENTDNRALAWLTRHGFHDANSALRVIRGWQHGNIRATRSLRARELLEDVLPELMSAIAGRNEPDNVLAKTARFLESLPAGVQMFSLVAHCPQLVQRLVDVLGASPWMSQSLVGNPQLLDTLLRIDQGETPASQQLRTELWQAADLEDAMNLARHRVQDSRFLLGAKILSGDFTWRDISTATTDLADAAVAGLADQVWRDMSDAIDNPPPRWAVLGFGKMGSREMGLLSDLDIVIVYAPGPDGDITQAASKAARFTRRLVSALSAPTEAGTLFEVDMALRPSGRSGPVAVSMDAFGSYYRQDAWVWEYLALTRARVVAASDPGFSDTLQAMIPELLSHCDASAIASDLAHMRLRLAGEKPQSMFWDIKHGAGGMMDLDFLVQVRKLLAIVDTDAVSPRAVNEAEIRNLYHGMSHVLSVTLGTDARNKVPDAPAISLLLSTTRIPDMAALQQRLSDARAEVAQALAQFGA